MSFNLRQLLGMDVFPNHQPLQQAATPIQRARVGGQIQMQHTGQDIPMAQAVQNAGGGMQQGLSAPNGTDPYMGGGNIQVPHPQLRNLLQLSGGSPQGFASDFGAAGFPQPNFQQAQPVQMQGVENPGLVPLQGSRGVRNPQSQAPKRRSPQITF